MQPARSVNDTAQFRENYVANEFVNALYALDSGYTGQGVTVGVMDDGVLASLPALRGQVSDLSKDFGSETRGGVTTKRDVLGDATSDHGTAIAAIIAARRDSGTTTSIAPDAKIAVLRTSDYNYDTATETLTHDAEALNYAASAGIKVINRSLSSQGFNVSLRNAVTSYAGTGGLLINAAGNNGGANPIDAVNVDASNRNSWLFVVALDPSSQSSYALASYSNMAGAMADRTVTGVGTNITTRIDGSVSSFSGTSSATAQVTGLAATILSKWPQLTGQQAGDVIIATARDIGPPGVDAIFGAGLVDVQAALSPVDPKLSNGTAQTAVAQSALVLPAGVGSGSLQTALSNVTVLDSFGRDFSGSLAGLVVKPDTVNPRWLRRRLAQMTGGGVQGFSAGPISASFGYASYLRSPDGNARGILTNGDVDVQVGKTGFHFGFNAQDSLQNDVMGLAPFADGTLAYAPQAGNSVKVDQATRIGRVGFSVSTGSEGSTSASAATLSLDTGRASLRASWIEERGSIMGSVSSGGLALGRGARTGLVEAHYTLPLAGDWGVEGYGSVGVTRIKLDPLSIVTGASSLVGTRAGLQFSGPALGGKLSFGVSQPLTIESGEARLTLGSGYDLATRSLLYSSSSASLASDRRRLQLTIGFVRGTTRSSLRLGVMRDITDRSSRALVGYSASF